MDWTSVYRDAVKASFVKMTVHEEQRSFLDDTVKPCRIIPCPGSYFPHHDEDCEMVWDDEAEGWVDCACEPRARWRRDREAVDG